jgi:hypothetical protein
MANIVFTAQGLQKILDDMKKIEAGGKKTTTLKFNADTKKAELDIKKLTNQKTKTQTIKVDADTKTAQQKLSALSNKVGSFGKDIKDQSGVATGGLNKMGAAAASAAGGMIGIQKGTDILQEYASAGMALTKQQALANDLFGALPADIEKVSASMRLSQAETLKLVNEYGLLAKGNGLAGKEAEAFAIRLATATRNVSLGSKKDLGEVQAAFSSFLKTGRTASLEGLGFDLTQIEKVKSGMSEAEFATKGLDVILGQMPEKWKTLSESQNSYGASSERLNAKMEDQKAKIGQVINEGLNKFAQVLIDLDTRFPGFINAVVGITAVLGALAIVLGIVAIAFGIVQIVTAPIIGIILAVIAIIGLLIAIFMNWDTLMKSFALQWEKIKADVINAFEQMKTNITNTWNGLMEFLGSIPGRVSQFFSGIGTKISEFFQQGVDNIKNMFNGILDWFKSLPQKIGDAFSSLGDIIKKALGSAVDLLPGPLQGPLKSALGLFETDFQSIIDGYANVNFDTSRFDFAPQGNTTTYNNATTMAFNKGIESRHERVKLAADMRKLRGRIK